MLTTTGIVPFNLNKKTRDLTDLFIVRGMMRCNQTYRTPSDGNVTKNFVEGRINVLNSELLRCARPIVVRVG